MIADRTRIFLYGPHDLEYDESHVLVVPRLEVEVEGVPATTAPDEPEPRSPAPAPGTTTEPADPRVRPTPLRKKEFTNLTNALDAVVEEVGEVDSNRPTVLFVTEGGLLGGSGLIFEAGPEDYRGIEHEGLIVDIDEVSSISARGLEVVEEIGATLELEKLPVNVRRIRR